MNDRVNTGGASNARWGKHGRCSATKEEAGTLGISVASANSGNFMDFQFLPYPNMGTQFHPMVDHDDHDFVPKNLMIPAHFCTALCNAGHGNVPMAGIDKFRSAGKRLARGP